MGMKKRKTRLDELLVYKGLATSLDLAGRYIMAGEVWLKTERLTQPGRLYPTNIAVELRRTDQDVSRGAKKLRSALDLLPVTISGRIALDLGASTGGFTQVLLSRAATRVYAFDVGQGLLHETLRNDARVTAREGANLKEWRGDWVPEPFSLIVADLSFVGLRTILPRVLADAQAPITAATSDEEPVGCDALLLLKPQFEVSKAEASRGKGIIRDSSIHNRLLDEFRTWEPAPGWSWVADCPSGLLGAKGNQEFFLHYRRPA